MSTRLQSRIRTASRAGQKAGAPTCDESTRAMSRSLLRSACQALAGIAIATVAGAAGPPPNLLDMHPHGGQQGRALRLVIEGYGVAGELEIESTLPGSFARLGEAADEDRFQKRRRPNDRNLQAAVFLVEIDADAAPGLYPLRAVSDDGLSNALLFRVDTVSEVSERSLRDGIRDSSTAAEPPRIDALPVVVNGTLDGAERDRYRFRAEAGERIVLEVEARRVGSAIDPVLRLLDAKAARSPSTRRDPASTSTPASTGSRRRPGSTSSKSTTPDSATRGGTSTASS